MASGNDWWQAVQEYDFDDAYFNNVGSSNESEENDDDWPDSEFEREEEAEFNLVNPLVGEMFAYMQRHYDKQPMRTSALTGKAYMDEVTEGNQAKCYEMFRMTPDLLLHLVDELVAHGYLKDGHGDVNATQAVAMLLYILGHNTRFRCVADRFQHSTETVCRHFRQALRAVHHYAKHLIKPDHNVTSLPEHLQVNKHWPWFERCIGAIDGTHVSARPPANATQAHRDPISDRKHGFPWPPTGSYYLVDSGLPIGTSFLPPHKSTRTIGESGAEGSATNNEGSGDAEAATSSATQRHVLEMSSASKRAMGQFRDNITDTMWDDYVARGNVR
nr:hypothetical protein CFP56_65761 [Quercus suber]